VLGVGLTGDQRVQHHSPRPPQHVADAPRDLEVGVQQHAVNALQMPAYLADELRAGPRLVAQLPDRRRRHEAAAHKAMRHELRQPGRVVHVALAPRHVAHVLRVRQH
jgi:hypothetical protein